MGNMFTLLGDQQELIPFGSVIDLKAASGKIGVDGYMNGQKVGSVSDQFFSDAKKEMSVEYIQKSVLEHPKCASAHGLVLSWKKLGTSGKILYSVELYAIPKRKNTGTASAAPSRYKAGGLSVRNPKKAEYTSKIQRMLQEDKPVRIPASILRERVGQTEEFFLCPEAVSAGSSAGTILGADQNLKDMIPLSSSIPAVIVGLEKNNIIVEVEQQAFKTEKFYPLIDEAAARCAGQCGVLEQKVKTMLSARFTEDAISAVIKQMPSLGAARSKVPNPEVKYTQKKGNNLSDLVSYMLMGKMVRLVGEKGSGKNTLIETACYLLNRPLCRVQGSSELDKLDLLGSRTLKNGNTAFELSEFLTTLKDDGIAVIDEANTVRPEVLTLLHSLTDGSRSIDVPGHGTVKMGPHACILFTLNEDYVGTGEMNAATIDRGPSMFIEQEADLESMLRSAVPNASDKNVKTCCKVSDEVRKAVRSGSTSLTVDAITVRGYIDALQCAPYIPLRRALIQNVANKAQTANERRTIEEIITANVL